MCTRDAESLAAALQQATNPTLSSPQALIGGYTRLKRWDILQFDKMERWITILLLWANSFSLALVSKPKVEQIKQMQQDFPKHMLLKAREFPLRLCYYDWEVFHSAGLLLEEFGSTGAFANQGVEAWMKMFNNMLRNSDGFAQCNGRPAGGASAHLAQLSPSPAQLACEGEGRGGRVPPSVR